MMNLKYLSKLNYFSSSCFSFLTLMILFYTYQYFIIWFQYCISDDSFYCLLFLPVIVGILREHISNSLFFSNVLCYIWKILEGTNAIFILPSDILLRKIWHLNAWLIISDHRFFDHRFFGMHKWVTECRHE